NRIKEIENIDNMGDLFVDVPQHRRFGSFQPPRTRCDACRPEKQGGARFDSPGGLRGGPFPSSRQTALHEFWFLMQCRFLNSYVNPVGFTLNDQTRLADFFVPSQHPAEAASTGFAPSAETSHHPSPRLPPPASCRRLPTHSWGARGRSERAR